MAFNLPNQLYSAPKYTTPWVRPNDWPIITDASKEIQFLVNDSGNATISLNTAFTANSGTKITIDWGDGTSTDVTTTGSTTTQHVYTVGSGTACSRGYTTFKIRVYADSPTVAITTCKPFSIDPSSFGHGAYVSVGLLEAYYGDGVQINFVSYFSSNAGNGSSSSYQYLEYVKLPDTYISGGSLAYTFMNCYNLQKVDMPKTIPASQTVNMTNTFLNCTSLREIILPYFPSTSTWGQNSTFQACTDLQSVNQYDASGNIVDTITGWSGGTAVFDACRNLLNMSINVSKVTSTANGMLSNCTSLTYANITGWPQGATCDMSSIFTGCTSLESVTLPASVTGSCVVTTTSMFNNCYLLKGSVYLPSGALFGSMATMFQNCYSLQGINIQNTTHSGAMSNMFGSCFALSYVTLPQTIGSVSLASMFLNCVSLTSFTIPSGWSTVTDMISMFSGCTRLKSVTFVPTSMNSVTSIFNTFLNCYVLESVSLPSSMSSVTNMTSAFNGCTSLVSVTMPNTLGSLPISNNLFNNCISLRSFTLPTFTPSGNQFTGVFTNCRSLKSIDISNVTLTSATNFSSIFSGCSNLESITLPNLPAVTNANSFISTCANLKTINNISNFGSTSANVAFSTNTNTNSLTGLTFSCRITAIDLSGTSTGKSALPLLRLLSTATGQWTGGSPQVNISYTNIGYTALVQLFNDIAATGTYIGKTINITGCAGASSLTAGDRTILTSKGWTITG